jgi:NADH-quinone oxidoreductase subunit J
MTATTAFMLYAVFALGGAGIYLLLPRPERPRVLAGAVIGLLALVGLMAVLAARVISPGGTATYYYVFATVALLAGSRVITHPKPVYSAIYFVLAVVAVAALLVLQDAEFLAVALIIIYAGAILVTYLFVIMLAHQGGSPVYDRRSREPLLSVLGGFVLMAAIAGHLGELPQPVTPSGAQASVAVPTELAERLEGSNTAGVGVIVMTKHVVVLEISGLLLLISMIGAIALARKKVPTEAFAPPARPLGQSGREVEPY